MNHSQPTKYRHVPKYAFISPQVWKLSELMKVPLIQALLAVGMLSSFYSYLKGAFPLVTYITAYLLLIMPQNLIEKRSEKAAKKHVKQICEDVTREAPGVNVKSWDDITERLNENIHSEGDWPSRFCLFDGRSCYTFFRQAILCPYYQSQETEEGARNSGEENQSLRHAVKAYEESLERWWKIFSKESVYYNYTEAVQQKLPKNFRSSKFSWASFFVLKVFLRADKILSFSNIAEFSLSFLVMCSLVPISKLRSYILLVSAGSLFGLVLFQIYLALLVFIFRIRWLLGTNHLMTWWAIISDINPGEDVEKWDIVAKTFNARWTVDDHCCLREFFFDGDHCMKTFRKAYPRDILENELWIKTRQDLVPFLKRALEASRPDSLH